MNAGQGEGRKVYLVLVSYYGMGDIVWGVYASEALAEAVVAAGVPGSDGGAYVAWEEVLTEPVVRDDSHARDPL